MNSKLKRPLLAAGIVVGVCALVWGGLTLLRNGSRSAVKVYPVTEIGMTEYGGDTTETSGTVTMDKLQKVYLSKTQSSAQVYVTEGQTVKKGDRLLSYDSTLTELDVERARIALERLRLQQENTRKELQQLQLAEDKEKLQQQADALSAKIEKKLAESTDEIIRRDSKPIQPGKPLLRGSAAGTAEDPLYCDWNGGDALTEQNLSVLLPEGEKELYVVLVTHRGDETLGDIIGSWGLHLIRGENGAISVSLAELPAAEDISVDGTTDEIRQLRKELQRVQELLSRSYTKAELLRMQNDKLREIQEADTSIKMAELDLRKKQTEASDGSVYSQLDGVVKAVRTPTDAAANNEAVVEVSAGGGYYVTGTDERKHLHRRNCRDQYLSRRQRLLVGWRKPQCILLPLQGVRQRGSAAAGGGERQHQLSGGIRQRRQQPVSGEYVRPHGERQELRYGPWRERQAGAALGPDR